MIEVTERREDAVVYRCGGIPIGRGLDVRVDVEAEVSADGRGFTVLLAVESDDSDRPGRPVTLTNEEIERVDVWMTDEMHRYYERRDDGHAQDDADHADDEEWLRRGSP